jgi:hypothetical protein
MKPLALGFSLPKLPLWFRSSATSRAIALERGEARPRTRPKTIAQADTWVAMHSQNERERGRLTAMWVAMQYRPEPFTPREIARLVGVPTYFAAEYVECLVAFNQANEVPVLAPARAGFLSRAFGRAHNGSIEIRYRIGAATKAPPREIEINGATNNEEGSP